MMMMISVRLYRFYFDRMDNWSGVEVEGVLSRKTGRCQATLMMSVARLWTVFSLLFGR